MVLIVWEEFLECASIGNEVAIFRQHLFHLEMIAWGKWGGGDREDLHMLFAFILDHRDEMWSYLVNYMLPSGCLQQLLSALSSLIASIHQEWKVFCPVKFKCSSFVSYATIS